jgi:hypothetical protein
MGLSPAAAVGDGPAPVSMGGLDRSGPHANRLSARVEAMRSAVTRDTLVPPLKSVNVHRQARRRTYLESFAAPSAGRQGSRDEPPHNGVKEEIDDAK